MTKQQDCAHGGKRDSERQGVPKEYDHLCDGVRDPEQRVVFRPEQRRP
jgi:hypothetical protein